MAPGDWQGFLGVILTLVTTIAAAGNWINSRLNSLSKEMLNRFDDLDGKYITRVEMDSMRSNNTERHREHDRRITNLEMHVGTFRRRVKDADTDQVE